MHGCLKSFLDCEVPPPRDLDREFQRRQDGPSFQDNIVAVRTSATRQLSSDPADSGVGSGDAAPGAGVCKVSARPSYEQHGPRGHAPLPAQLPARSARQLRRGGREPLGAALPHQGWLSAVECPGVAALAAQHVFFLGILDPLADHVAEVGFLRVIEVYWRTLRLAQH